MVWARMIRVRYPSAATRFSHTVRFWFNRSTRFTHRFVSGRRPSTASTASNSAPDDDGSLGSSSRDRDEESRRARRASRANNDRTAVGIDTSQGRHERGNSSSSGRHRSSRSSSTRDKRVEEPGSPLPHGVCLCRFLQETDPRLLMFDAV